MKSKKQGYSYIIQEYDDQDPQKLNKKKTDTVLDTIEKSLRILAKTFADLYDDDTELYWFIHDHMYLPDSYYICGDKLPENLSDMYRSIKDLQDFLLEHDDEISPPKSYITLEELGFKDMFHYNRIDEPHVYERTIEDLGEKEVTEEVVIHNGDIFHRQRTTLWDITPGRKSSRSITYKKLRMTKKLREAAENSMMFMKKREES